MDPEIKAVADKLLALAERVKTWAQEGAGLLLELQDAGVDLRQLDADTLRTRFFDQLPLIVERKAGALLPPVKGDAAIAIDAVQVKS